MGLLYYIIKYHSVFGASTGETAEIKLYWCKHERSTDIRSGKKSSVDTILRIVN